MAIEKCEKECNMFLIILLQGFCPLKISQFSNGFCLNDAFMVSDRGQKRYSGFVALETLLRFENCSSSLCLLSL